MLRKLFLIAAPICFVFNSLQAQKKYEKIMYNNTTAEGEGMTVTCKDIVSTKDITKFNLKITNKTDEVLLYKPEESVLKVNNKEFKPKEKWLEVAPTETDNRVVNFNGSDFLVPGYSYEVNGVYKVSTTNNSVAAADFQLPASQNEFKAGNFTCNMSDLTKKTDKTTVKFECRYTGDKIGVINQKNATIKLPDGTEIANEKPKASPVLLAKGETKKITLSWDRMQGGKATDMQKINLLVIWHNTFVESDPVKLKPVTLDFKINEAESK